MSVNSVRRHRTPRLEVVAAPGRRQAELIHTLMRLRERLALAAAAYEAHDLDGAADVLEQQWTIENSIRLLAPSVYEERWPEWIEFEAALIHTPETPSDRCHICGMSQARAA